MRQSDCTSLLGWRSGGGRGDRKEKGGSDSAGEEVEVVGSVVVVVQTKGCCWSGLALKRVS